MSGRSKRHIPVARRAIPGTESRGFLPPAYNLDKISPEF
jgi:hypothetical protein